MFKNRMDIIASAVFSALLVVGLGGAFAFIQNRSSRIADSHNGTRSGFTKSENQVLFTEMLLFDGKTEGRFRFTTQTYQSWDCMILRKRVEFLNSPANAKSELRKTVGQAAELFERGEKFDSTGQLIGERAVVRLTKDKETSEIRIVWTENSE